MAANFATDSDLEGLRSRDNVHAGKGTISVKLFPFSKAPSPASFLIYDIPPGASEGVHKHVLNDPVLGSWDEYYYIIHGNGQMEIDGQIVPVKAGDHIHTPLDVLHGIENTSSSGNLKVFLTYIARS